MKKTKKPDPTAGKEAFSQHQALGAHFIAQEVAITAILDVLSKTQPTNAALVCSAMAEIAAGIPKDRYPGVAEKTGEWIAMMAATIAKQPQ